MTDVVATLLERMRRGAKEKTDVAGALELVLSGGEPFHLVIGDGNVERRSGEAPTPTIIVRVVAEDLEDILNGELDVQQALLDGRLRVSGDLMGGTPLLQLAFDQD